MNPDQTSLLLVLSKKGNPVKSYKCKYVNLDQSIILVEDSRTQAARLKTVVESRGYIVRVAHCGEDAITFCREEQPDLLVTDVTMPGMDGFQLCGLIKGDEELLGIPVMLLTGLADPKDIIYGLEAGADCYLTKPYSDDELCNRIEFVLQNEADAASSEELTKLPLDVTFLGQKHTVTSSRRQILSLLLSTYESAARRNKALDKARLRMKMELKESKRKSEGAEAALAIFEAELEDSANSFTEIFKAFPLPVYLFNDGDIIKQSKVPLDQGRTIESWDDLLNSGLNYIHRDFSLDQEEHTLALVLPEAPTTTTGGESALSPELKRRYAVAVSAQLHEGLNEIKELAASASEGEELTLALTKLATLDFVECDSLESHLVKKPLDLKSLVELVVNSTVLQTLSDLKKQKLVLAEAEEASINGDAFKILQALRGLVENAIQFSPESTTISLSLRSEGTSWTLAITDQGPGLPANIAAQATEPFVSSLADRMGLGLSFAKRVCLSHGGELSLSGESGLLVSMRFPQQES